MQYYSTVQSFRFITIHYTVNMFLLKRSSIIYRKLEQQTFRFKTFIFLERKTITCTRFISVTPQRLMVEILLIRCKTQIKQSSTDPGITHACNL